MDFNLFLLEIGVILAVVLEFIKRLFLKKYSEKVVDMVMRLLLVLGAIILTTIDYFWLSKNPQILITATSIITGAAGTWAFLLKLIFPKKKG